MARKKKIAERSHAIHREFVPDIEPWGFRLSIRHGGRSNNGFRNTSQARGSIARYQFNLYLVPLTYNMPWGHGHFDRGTLHFCWSTYSRGIRPGQIIRWRWDNALDAYQVVRTSIFTFSDVPSSQTHAGNYSSCKLDIDWVCLVACIQNGDQRLSTANWIGRTLRCIAVTKTNIIIFPDQYNVVFGFGVETERNTLVICL